jgi:hypothetical protein
VTEREAGLASRGWLRWACIGGVVALAAIGVLLLGRRIAGGITGDVPAGMLIVTAIVAIGIVIGGRLIWRFDDLPVARMRSQPRQRTHGAPPALETAFGWGGLVALGLVALGCSLGRGWDWLIWLPLVGVEQWQLRWFLRGGGRNGSNSQIVDSHEGRASRELHGSLTPEEIPPLAPPFKGGGLLVQQLLRLRDANGVESVQGTLRAEFVAGQRQATLYMGFCPPLARAPVIEAECVDGPEAELKVAQAFCHGARLEVRLTESAGDECSVDVEVVARPQQGERIEHL